MEQAGGTVEVQLWVSPAAVSLSHEPTPPRRKKSVAMARTYNRGVMTYRSVCQICKQLHHANRVDHRKTMHITFTCL
jgi:cytochrome c5